MKQMFILLVIGFSLFNTKEIISKELVTMREKLILLDSINKYRTELGMKKLEYSVDAERLAKIRTKNISNHLKSLDSSEYVKSYKSQLHYGFALDHLIFNNKLELYGKKYIMPFAYENVCHIPKMVDNLIIITFQGWKNSPSHWYAMMSEDVDHIALHYEESEIGIIADMILFDEMKK